jgi:hypothetical protein
VKLEVNQSGDKYQERLESLRDIVILKLLVVLEFISGDAIILTFPSSVLFTVSLLI